MDQGVSYKAMHPRDTGYRVGVVLAARKEIAL